MTSSVPHRPEAFHLDFPGPGPVRSAVERLLGLTDLEARYASIPAVGGAAFVAASLGALRVTYDVSAPDAARIPARGPLVVVANHPFGGVEGLVLLDLLLGARSDVRILGNRLLSRIPELRDVLLDVDVFGGRAAAASNRSSLRAAVRHLRRGGALAAFPAGEVSHVRVGRGVADRPWCEDVAALARLGGADVLPVRFEGANGPIFQAAGLVHPALRTALLPRELLNKSGRTIRVRVGSAVSRARLDALGTDGAATDLLRMRCDLLARRAPPAPASRRESEGTPVAAPEEPDALAAEIAALPADRTLSSNGALSVRLVRAQEALHLLREVGRLREVTFREVGEGTGRSRDLDRFDERYSHLVLWDTSARAVAGAYRFVTTDELGTDGADGLYTSTLFRFRPEFLARLGPAVELGRSFVAPAWQRSFSPLMLLWKAIGEVVLRQPHCRALFGPVSISRRYAPFARQLMVEWLRVRAGAPEFEPLVVPRRALRPAAGDARRAREAGARIADLDELSEAVGDIDPALRGVPVLVREYHRLAGRFAAFSEDADFGHVVDGLVVVDLTRTDLRTLSRYMGKDGARRFLAYHAAACPPSRT